MMETGIRDPEAFLREAASLHAQAVYNVCLKACGGRADAEDATQEAFASLAREWRDIRDPGSVRTWLLRVALRTCWRASARARKRSQAEREVATMRPEETEGRTGLVSWLRDAVDRLPEALRMPLVLRYYQGLGYEEMAAVLGCPVGSVSARLREGQEALRKALPAGLAAVTLAGMEEALGAVPPEPVPAGLISAIQAASGQAAAGISMATWGGAAMTIKKTALVTAAILLLIVGIWMALAPGRPPVQAARPGPAGAPVRLPAPEAAEVPRPSLPSPSQAPAPEGPAIAGQSAVLSGRVFDRRTNRPIRNALVAWSIHGDRPGAFQDTVRQAPVAASGDKVAEDEAIDGGKGGTWVSGPDFITLTNAEGRYRLEIPPAWVSLSYDLEVETETFVPFKPLLSPPLGEAGERTQDISLTSGWTLRLSVTSDADGKPVAGLVYVAFTMGGIQVGYGDAGLMQGALCEIAVPSDTEMFPPGMLSLKVSAEGYVGKTVSLAGIPFVDDVMSVAVSLQPFPPERQVYGRLLDPEGRPVEHGLIDCWPASMRMSEAYEQGALIAEHTLKDGSFRFNHHAALKEDPLFLLWVDGAGKGDGLGGILRAPLIAKAGAEAILRLDAAVETISGRVLDAEGAPAAGAIVTANFEGLEEKYLGSREVLGAGLNEEGKRYVMSRGRWAKTDAEGRFVLRGLPAGETGRVIASPAARPTPPGPGIFHSESPPIRGWTGVAAGTSDLEIRLGEGEDLRPFGK